METLRLEAEDAHTKVEELAHRVKVLEQENLSKEQEISSLTHRNSLLDAEVEKLEKALADAKTAADTGTVNSTELESMSRKLQLLEEEAEEADKNLRETNEKYVPFLLFPIFNMTLEPYRTQPVFTMANSWLIQNFFISRLRLTDVKAEHYERKVATVEAERDGWEKKYEEVMEKYKASQAELDAISKQLDDI
jgi:tropomyosin